MFFLHGTSIGNGQQGISYNVLGLNADFVLHKICDLGAVRYQLKCVGFKNN